MSERAARGHGQRALGAPLFLLSGVRGLREGPVTTLDSQIHPLRPGRPFAFAVGPTRYRLSLTRSTQGYQLTVAEGARSDLIVLSRPPEVRWIGDLDGDGGPDVLLTADDGLRLLLLAPVAARGQGGAPSSALRTILFVKNVSC